jgi:hypothetical protein
MDVAGFCKVPMAVWTPARFGRFVATQRNGFTRFGLYICPFASKHPRSSMMKIIDFLSKRFYPVGKPKVL